jgi:hypothetical protein
VGPLVVVWSSCVEVVDITVVVSSVVTTLVGDCVVVSGACVVVSGCSVVSCVTVVSDINIIKMMHNSHIKLKYQLSFLITLKITDFH